MTTITPPPTLSELNRLTSLQLISDHVINWLDVAEPDRSAAISNIRLWRKFQFLKP